MWYIKSMNRAISGTPEGPVSVPELTASEALHWQRASGLYAVGAAALDCFSRFEAGRRSRVVTWHAGDSTYTFERPSLPQQSGVPDGQVRGPSLWLGRHAHGRPAEWFPLLSRPGTPEHSLGERTAEQFQGIQDAVVHGVGGRLLNAIRTAARKQTDAPFPVRRYGEWLCTFGHNPAETAVVQGFMRARRERSVFTFTIEKSKGDMLRLLPDDPAAHEKGFPVPDNSLLHAAWFARALQEGRHQAPRASWSEPAYHPDIPGSSPNRLSPEAKEVINHRIERLRDHPNLQQLVEIHPQRTATFRLVCQFPWQPDGAAAPTPHILGMRLDMYDRLELELVDLTDRRRAQDLDYYRNSGILRLVQRTGADGFVPVKSVGEAARPLFMRQLDQLLKLADANALQPAPEKPWQYLCSPSLTGTIAPE